MMLLVQVEYKFILPELAVGSKKENMGRVIKSYMYFLMNQTYKRSYLQPNKK